MVQPRRQVPYLVPWPSQPMVLARVSHTERHPVSQVCWMMGWRWVGLAFGIGRNNTLRVCVCVSPALPTPTPLFLMLPLLGGKPSFFLLKVE